MKIIECLSDGFSFHLEAARFDKRATTNRLAEAIATLQFSAKHHKLIIYRNAFQGDKTKLLNTAGAQYRIIAMS